MKTLCRLAVIALVLPALTLAPVRSEAQLQRPQLQKPELPGKMETPKLPQVPGLPCLADVQNHAARLVQSDIALRNALPAEGGRLGSFPNEAISISAHVTSLAGAAVTTIIAFAPTTVVAAAAASDIQAQKRQEAVQRWREQWDSVKARYSQSLQNLASRATTDGMRKAAQDAASAVAAAGDSLANCMQAAIQGGQVPQIPGAVAGTFETTIAGFHVKLESGAANRGAGTMTLTGTVSVTPVGNAPPFRLIYKNSNSILAQTPPPSVASVLGTATPRPSGRIAAGPQSAQMAVSGKLHTMSGQAQPESWLSISATGSLDVQAGSVTFTIPNASLKLASDGTLYLSGGDVNLLGCTHQVSNGSAVRPDMVELWGQIRCGNLVAPDSLLSLNAGGVGGASRVQMLGHGFDLYYSLGAGRLQAASTWTPASLGWQSVPGSGGAQFRVSNPRVIVRIDGASAGAGFYVDRVEAKSTANKPNGEPWASAQASPPPLGFSVDGRLALPLPQLPIPQVVLPQFGDCLCDAACGELSALGLAARVPSGTGFGSTAGSIDFTDGTRSQCKINQSGRAGSGPLDGKCQADTKCPVGWERYWDNGSWRCRIQGLKPPSIPTLPTSVSIQLSAVVVVN